MGYVHIRIVRSIKLKIKFREDKMIKGEAAKDFIARLKSMPDLDLTDRKTAIEFGNRVDIRTRPEIERQDRLQARSLAGVFTKVVR
jgi:hypothetical protein